MQSKEKKKKKKKKKKNKKNKKKQKEAIKEEDPLDKTVGVTRLLHW